jgi:hypothetical protein
MNVLRTKRGKRKTKGLSVKAEGEPITAPVTTPAEIVATTADTAVHVVDIKEEEVEEEKVEDSDDAQQEWVVLDDISSGRFVPVSGLNKKTGKYFASSSDEDMDLETDEDDGRFYVKINDLLLLPSRSQRPKK